MLMSSMREKTKIVLFVALLAFVGLIFFDWGMQGGGGGGGQQGPGGSVAEVNGRAISWDRYRFLRQQVIANFESQTGRSAEFSDYDSIDDDVWLTLIQEAVLEEQVERFKVSISDAEILETLRSNPPASVRASFIDDQGQFDVASYAQALSDPNLATQWAGVEEFMRQTMPPEKVQNYVGLAARVTSDEVRERFLARNEKVKVRHVVSAPARVELTEADLNEAALNAYYQAHLQEYQSGERAVLDFVRASKAASAQDTLDTREDLESLREEILAGSEFADVASTWSEDGSATRGGDLGLVGKGDMVPEFEAMAWATAVGEVSPVFSTPFGYHILQVNEITTEAGKDKRRVSHILLRVGPSTYTLREASDKIDDFLDGIADGAKFEAAATAAGLTVESSGAFERGEAIPNVGPLRRAERFAFSNEPGTLSTDPIEDESAIYAFRVAQRLPGGQLPFEEVKDRVLADVTEEKQRKRAREKMEQALASSDGSLESIAAALGDEVRETIEFSRESFVPSIGRRNAFVAAAFSLEPGERSGIVDSDRGFYVMELVERFPVDEAAYAEQLPQLRQQILFEKRQTLITAWLESLILNADVVDYRAGGDGVQWTADPSSLQYSVGA